MLCIIMFEKYISFCLKLWYFQTRTLGGNHDIQTTNLCKSIQIKANHKKKNQIKGIFANQHKSQIMEKSESMSNQCKFSNQCKSLKSRWRICQKKFQIIQIICNKYAWIWTNQKFHQQIDWICPISTNLNLMSTP